MARINTPQTAGQDALRTHEGAIAHRIDAVSQLRRSVMACLLWEQTFYEDGVEIAARIDELVGKVGAPVASAIAIHAREQMHLRHVPLWIVRAMARHYGGDASGFVRPTLSRVIQRADELAEFVSLYWLGGKQPLSAQVKRGLAEAFVKFDAYQLAKYNRDGAVKLRDVLFLCHAKPGSEEQAATWKQLIDGTLPAPDTWEVALSSGADKREAWIRLIVEKKLGGLALLRNLRNMVQAGVPEGIILAAIAEQQFHRVLPFRFVAAARIVPQFEPGLEKAMLASLAEAPKLAGKTALLVDVSGSMGAPLSDKSDLNRQDAAAALAVLLREVCENVDVISFSNRAELVPPRQGFALMDAIDRSQAHMGTRTDLGVRLANERGYDRIIVLTDEQSHTNVAAPLTPLAYFVNVAPYRNGIGYGKWTHIDGWSEAIIRYILEAEAASAVNATSTW